MDIYGGRLIIKYVYKQILYDMGQEYTWDANKNLPSSSDSIKAIKNAEIPANIVDIRITVHGCFATIRPHARKIDERKCSSLSKLAVQHSNMIN